MYVYNIYVLLLLSLYPMVSVRSFSFPYWKSSLPFPHFCNAATIIAQKDNMKIHFKYKNISSNASESLVAFNNNSMHRNTQKPIHSLFLQLCFRFFQRFCVVIKSSLFASTCFFFCSVAKENEEKYSNHFRMRTIFKKKNENNVIKIIDMLILPFQPSRYSALLCICTRLPPFQRELIRILSWFSSGWFLASLFFINMYI